MGGFFLGGLLPCWKARFCFSRKFPVGKKNRQAASGFRLPHSSGGGSAPTPPGDQPVMRDAAMPGEIEDRLLCRNAWRRDRNSCTSTPVILVAELCDD